MSYFTQMLGLAVQNFVCAASGMAVLVALIRGLTRKTTSTLGSFWVDLVRSTLYVLLPLSIVVAVLLVSQGVVQTFHAYATVPLLQATKDADGKAVTDQVLALGPAASQIAIKMLGTNGGGFFNANSAHPFENPTGLSNFLEMWSLLVIPAALCLHVRQDGEGHAPGLGGASRRCRRSSCRCSSSASRRSRRVTPRLHGLAVDQAASALQSGGNMEGKEVRFGIANSGLFATITTAVSCGAVNGMHDSLHAARRLRADVADAARRGRLRWRRRGLYGMLMFAVVAVFVAGLMVGRTPEYLGKKIEAYEMKMASLVVLIPPATVLIMTAIAVVTEAGRRACSTPARTGSARSSTPSRPPRTTTAARSAASAATTPFYNTTPRPRDVLRALLREGAGARARGTRSRRRRSSPRRAGTLPTHTPLFVAMLVGVVILVGALTFIPALALGPFVEQLLAQS